MERQSIYNITYIYNTYIHNYLYYLMHYIHNIIYICLCFHVFKSTYSCPKKQKLILIMFEQFCCSTCWDFIVYIYIYVYMNNHPGVDKTWTCQQKHLTQMGISLKYQFRSTPC